MPCNLLNQAELNKLKDLEPDRFKQQLKGGDYLRIQGLDLAVLEGIAIPQLENLARIMRGLIFTTIEAARSGHPGGPSSKVEQFLAMTLGGVMAFDPLEPKHHGRDRVVWSAGHCSAGLYAGLTIIYEILQKAGKDFDAAKLKAVMAKDLPRFRRPDGPQGHIEHYQPLSDIATGPSGHGMPSAGGLAIVHKSCGLDTRVWVLMGDAESEEGMTYEARNILYKVGADNLIVSMDYNHFGIDGDIDEVIATPFINHWLGLGWNVIEVDGHNILELIYAYRLAREKYFANGNPTVVLAHSVKGKEYGATENSNKSHGAPAKFPEYVEIMKNLGFNIPAVEGEVARDIEVVVSQLDEELVSYVVERLEVGKSLLKPEAELIEQMKQALPKRNLVNPLDLKRPKTLPEELVFAPDEKGVATRKASKAWFDWLMKETAFFWAGAGDLASSILTNSSEDIYGLITRDNPLGRGLRYGIAEQNMAMMAAAMTTDRLPGDFAPVSVFSSYGVFTSMMCNAVRLVLIANQLYPERKGFFVMLAAHDGPETGEDGPTHQGLFWMSMYNAYPGIKVYKPMDANETVEMLFYALEQGEPIALSVARPNTPVFDREKYNMPAAREAVNGAYVARGFKDNANKKATLVVCGGQVMSNVLEVLDEIESQGLDIKIVAVTSPELFEDLRENNPEKANEIFSDEDRERVVALHNGWPGFLYPFLLPKDYTDRNIAIDKYLQSGNAKEVYALAGLAPEDLKNKILKASK